MRVKWSLRRMKKAQRSEFTGDSGGAFTSRNVDRLTPYRQYGNMPPCIKPSRPLVLMLAGGGV